MLGIESEDTRAPKCHFTHAALAEHIDDKQPPTKKKPFSTVAEQPFSHTADLILPEEIYEAIRQELDGAAGTFHYARVIMSLGEIIDGDFFNFYIKTGNVMMISEGRSGIDNVYSLREGILRLELDRATYERCGLQGKPISHGGKKHTKERFAVELELRKPSMLHGKKGFERIVWAFNHVLNQRVTWLFHDLRNPEDQLTGPITKLHPSLQTVHHDRLHLPRTKVPALTSLADLSDPEYGGEVLEWFGMVSLESPRIKAGDSVDSFLSRYEVPMPYCTDGDGDAPAVRTIVRLRWRGLLPVAFLLRLWMAARKRVGAANGGNGWMALSVAGFRDEAYTMLGVGARDVLSWECK